MSKIINFYAQQGTDHKGRNLADIWSFDAEQLEYTHDYIQWLFPLSVPSNYNSNAPVLTKDDIRTFSSNDKLKTNLEQSFRIMLRFYGLGERGDHVVKTKNYQVAAENWVSPYNHNFLRISRILTSLSLLGLEHKAQNFLKKLHKLPDNHKEIIGRVSFGYWQEAIKPGTPSPK